MTSSSCEIRSAVNHRYFILKVNHGCFILYLHTTSCPARFCSVLNLCAVLRRTAKIEALRICCEGWRMPAPFRTHDVVGGRTHVDLHWCVSAPPPYWSGSAAVPQSVEFWLKSSLKVGVAPNSTLVMWYCTLFNNSPLPLYLSPSLFLSLSQLFSGSTTYTYTRGPSGLRRKMDFCPSTH